MLSPPLVRTSASVAKSSGGQTGSSRNIGAASRQECAKAIASSPFKRTVHVDHQRNAGTDRLPRGKYRRRRGLMQLDRLVAPPQHGLAFACDQFGLADPQQARIGGNPRAFGLADQPVQRHALRLGGKIPQRDIERGYREHGDAIAAEQMQVALDLFHEGGNTGRVGDLQALRLRRDHFLDGGVASFAGRHRQTHRPSR